MSKIQRTRAQPRGKDCRLFKPSEQITSNVHLYNEWKLFEITSGECLDQPIERPFTTPMIVTFPGWSIEAESNMTDGSAIIHQGRPNAFEVPTVCNKTRGQPRLRNGLQYVAESWMQRWFATSEDYRFDTGSI